MIASTIVIRTSSPLPLPTDEAVCDGASSSPSPPLFEVFDVDRALTVSVWLMCDGDRGKGGRSFYFIRQFAFSTRFLRFIALHTHPLTRPPAPDCPRRLWLAHGRARKGGAVTTGLSLSLSLSLALNLVVGTRGSVTPAFRHGSRPDPYIRCSYGSSLNFPTSCVPKLDSSGQRGLS